MPFSEDAESIRQHVCHSFAHLALDCRLPDGWVGICQGHEAVARGITNEAHDYDDDDDAESYHSERRKHESAQDMRDTESDVTIQANYC